MALLQDEEARRRKLAEQQLRTVGRAARYANLGLIVSVVIVGALMLIAVLVLLPSRNTENIATTNQSEELARIRALLDAQSAAVIPEAIESVRSQLAQGTFALLVNPSAQSVSPGSSVRFDVYIVRSDNFTGEVGLALLNAPDGLTGTFAQSVIARDAVATTLTLAATEELPVDTYALTVSGGAANLSSDATLNVTVSRMVAMNIRTTEVRAMDQGTQWQATVAWDTDTAANTWVEYAPQEYFSSHNLTYNFTATEETNATNHLITFTNLEPNTIYHYRVKSTDEHSNVLVSTDQYFYTVGQ